ncbi:hypothetical protein B0I18_103165 [Taibaiella chishuiensis]|uniref:Uncharacterized protein n=1 Tax=Taibaiella chishuiensis TaxID=1434707 RepID=A0A2P8D5V8_9BACT|nr:hypothetical protein B0I18_103165 [Taibaiella chishuiensis]
METRAFVWYTLVVTVILLRNNQSLYIFQSAIN